MARISEITPKIEWAHKHIAELESAILAFKGTDPYGVAPKRNSETGGIDYCVAEAPDVPVEIRLLSGEIIQNLRSALDYLIVQLLDVEGKQPNSRTGFPIYNSLEKFKADPLGKIELIQRQSSIDKIKATNAYKGGNDTFWKLHWLNIRDKHHLLIVVGMDFSTVDVFGHFKRMGIMPPQIETGAFHWRPAGKSKICPLKVNDVLFPSPASKVDEEIEFTCEIAFNEPGICEGESLLETLHGMAQLVDNTVAEFIPLL
jgi:hypothetical protein